MEGDMNAIRKTKKRAKVKSVKNLRHLAWNLLSKIIRQSNVDHRDIGKCFTCDQEEHWKYLQAGHAIGGRHNAVLFDESIIRTQCATCNFFRRGNYQIFVTKLIEENGMDWWKQKLSDSKVLKTYTRSDYETMIENYRERLEKLDMKVPF
jgi:hypothetical protein